MQQIYSQTPMPKFDFNKGGLLLKDLNPLQANISFLHTLKTQKILVFFYDVFTEYTNGTSAREKFSMFIFSDRQINIKVKILKLL